MYTQEDLQTALTAWANAKPGERDKLWCLYCDIRDNLPIGTTEAARGKSNQRLNKPFMRPIQ